MSANYMSARRLIFGALVALAVGAFAIASITGHLGYAIFGLAVFQALLLGLAVAVYLKLNANASSSRKLEKSLNARYKESARMREYVREELERSKKFRLRVHEKLSQINRGSLDLHSAVFDSLRVVGEAQAEMSSSQIELRRSVIDSQVLVLRAFQDVTEEVSRVRSAIQDVTEEVSRVRSAIPEDRSGALSEKVDEGVATLSERLAGTVVPLRVDVGALDAKVGTLVSTAEQLVGKNKTLHGLFRRGGDWIRYETAQEVEAIHVLRDLLQVRGDVPLLGGWAVDPSVMVALVRHVLRESPRLVVECGSGASTIWLARALEVAGRGKLVALEHDEVYVEKGRRLLEQNGLSSIAEIVHAPIAPVDIGGESHLWYAAAALAGLDDIELLFVDGPPQPTAPLARYPALPMLGPRLAAGAAVVVDDYNRGEERKMVKLWRQMYPGLGEPQALSSRAALLFWQDNG